MSAYTDALQHLTDEEWASLSVQEKLDTLQAVENEVALREGRYPCKVHGQNIPTTNGGITLGYYSRNDRTITINTEQLEERSKYGADYRVHLDTVLHEGRHAYQHQAVNGEIVHDNSEELNAWKENLQPGHYITYERNPRAYYSQPVEQDARSYARRASFGIEEEKEMLKEQLNKAEVKKLVRDPEELRKSGQKNIEDILDMRRDDLRDKGMKDGPEMEQLIQQERKQLQEEFNRDAFGINNADKENTDSEGKQFRQTSSTEESNTTHIQESTDADPQNSKDAKKAMFSGSSNQHDRRNSSERTNSKASSKSRGLHPW